MSYLHGYSERESDRLRHQATFLARWVLNDRPLVGARRILEIGSGVGAQTELLLDCYPGAHVVAVEREPANYHELTAWLAQRPSAAHRVSAVHADARELPADLESCDAAYVCWVLEHVEHPVELLGAIRQHLVRGARLLVQEVFNRSWTVHPTPSTRLTSYVRAFDTLQERFGGDPNVGSKLGQLLHEAGYVDIVTSALLIQVDDRDPAERAAMFDYLAELYRSAEGGLVAAGMATEADGEAAQEELRRLGRTPGVVFHYTAVRALARTA
ncbi:MAG TPA: methyltransferase domain-containing protein [Polyangiaceae bacterium]|nr:methyltransferase domain-containing protein [Polyangiaceae bacterium]